MKLTSHIILQNIETQTFKYTLFIVLRQIYTKNCDQNMYTLGNLHVSQVNRCR